MTLPRNACGWFMSSPMPDLFTGEPRPPHAPRQTVRDEPTPVGRMPITQPPPPVDFGPLLEWSRYRRRTAWYATAITWLLLAGLMWSNYKSFEWITEWFLWPFFVSPLWFFPRVVRHSWVAAGATWVQGHKNWVNTYELVKIEWYHDGILPVTRLTDSSDRRVAIHVKDIQPNIAMWDLVYNGMLHSIENGNCVVTPRAQRELRLPPGAEPPPERQKLWIRRRAGSGC